MAARSVVVVLVNTTGRHLTLEDVSLAHGIWPVPAPNAIVPHSEVRWRTESSGFATGTEGRANYHVDQPGSSLIPSPDPTPLHLHWNNPFAGSNSYHESAPPGFVVIHDGGGGDNATVKFFLTQTIESEYLDLGGPTGWLGPPTDGEKTAPDGNGRFRHFQRASIYWTPRTGAHEVHGAIRDKWASLGWERSFLGYPLTDESGTPDGVGRFNHFQGGSIYWTPRTGAHEVHGAIRDKWASLGWERSRFGYPTSDELPEGAHGRVSNFEHGSIFWSAQTGAIERP
jgi:hypothetical protein